MIRSLLGNRQLDLFEQPPRSPAPDSHWAVRRSGKAKYLRINVLRDGKVEIVAPRWAKPAEIQAFVAEHTAWVKTQLAKLEPVDHRAPTTIDLAALRRIVEVEYAEAGEPVWSWVEKHRLLVSAEQAEHGAALRDWLKHTARDELTTRVETLSEQTELSYRRLQWRVQKTRWGSCSSNQTISLNASILLLAPELADYVILHELCHLRYMSHGPRFWGLLSRHCQQDAKSLDRQISQFGLEQLGWLYA